jgi:protein-L-isoaspartate(D-aspartate) O-methyltransferase
MANGAIAQTFEEARARLVESLRPEISDERVLAAFGRVRRERFVPAEYRHAAYNDRPLPIGHGQTISQPLMVALMLQEMRLLGDEKVLDIGTGSGYQAALLAELAREVVSVERIPELAGRAAQVLAELGYKNVVVHLAGEVLGWPEAAPYDSIVVAAASPRVPQSLVDQLVMGGRLVIPVGERGGQDLLVVERTEMGTTVSRRGGCRFVPLVGKEAFAEEASFSDPSL